MYASLIGAGVSQLYDLYKSATESSASTSAASKTTPTSFQPDAGESPASDGSAPAATGAVNSSSGSGGRLSDTVKKLLADFQSGASTAASGTSDAASKLQSLSKQLGTGHAHRGHVPSPGNDQPVSASSASSNPVQNVAASLLAYAKSQGLTASAGSTSLAA